MQETFNSFFGSKKRSTTLRQAITGLLSPENHTTKSQFVMLHYCTLHTVLKLYIYVPLSVLKFSKIEKVYNIAENLLSGIARYNPKRIQNLL